MARRDACRDFVLTIRAELQSTVEKSPAAISRTYVVVRQVSRNRCKHCPADGFCKILRCTRWPRQGRVRDCAAGLPATIGVIMGSARLFIGTRPRDGRLARRETDNVRASVGGVSCQIRDRSWRRNNDVQPDTIGAWAMALAHRDWGSCPDASWRKLGRAGAGPGSGRATGSAGRQQGGRSGRRRAGRRDRRGGRRLHRRARCRATARRRRRRTARNSPVRTERQISQSRDKGPPSSSRRC